jgi:AraC-like DNA-binding protein
MLLSVRYVELEPAAPLRGRVRFWRLSGAGGERAPEPVLPDGCVELIVHLGDPFRVWTERGLELQPRLLLAGPGTRPVRLAPTGRIDVIGARFEAGAASALAPLAELVDVIPALDAVRGELAHGLGEELAEPRRGERWTDVLTRRLAPWLRAVDPLVERAVARLRASNGRVTIDALAGELGLSTRQLERRFHAHVGFGPKLFARLTRFQHAWRTAGCAPSLAALAARAGYFDQAHLVRDFRQFAGAPPSRFLREEHELARLFGER